MDYRREEVATLRLNQGTDEEAVVIITVLPDHKKLALCLSSVEDGDAEIYLTPGVCEEVIACLREAVDRLQIRGEVPRIALPRTPVNRARRRARATERTPAQCSRERELSRVFG